MNLSQTLAVGAGEVDMGGDMVVRAGGVASLEMQPDRHPGGPVEIRALGSRSGSQVPAGQCGPERALAVERVRRDVQAQLVRATRAHGGQPGRPGHRRLAVPRHQAEREPAGAVGDDQVVIPVPHARAQCSGAGGGLVQRLGRGVDVQVEMATGGAVGDALDPQAGVPPLTAAASRTPPPARGKGDSVLPVISRQNATPGPKSSAGKSRKMVSHRNAMPPGCPIAAGSGEFNGTYAKEGGGDGAAGEQ
jgi:hypothetical protein